MSRRKRPKERVLARVRRVAVTRFRRREREAGGDDGRPAGDVNVRAVDS